MVGYTLKTINDDLDDLYRFRYGIYVEEMNRPQKDADHATKKISDALDEKGFQFIASETREKALAKARGMAEHDTSRGASTGPGDDDQSANSDPIASASGVRGGDGLSDGTRIAADVSRPDLDPGDPDERIIVGCMRLNFTRDGDVGLYHQLYGLGRLTPEEYASASISTRLMVNPAYRSSMLPVKLFKEVYRFGVQNGLETNFIDCNKHLESMFLRLGYRRLFDAMHPEYGRVAVMRLNLLDQEHLDAVRSPLSIMCRRYLAGRSLKAASGI